MLSGLLGSSSTVREDSQGLRFGYSTPGSFVPEGPPKSLAPKPLFQGFLVLYHGVKRLRFQVPPSAASCLLELQPGQQYLGVPLPARHLPGVPYILRKSDMVVSVMAERQERGGKR